MSTIRVVWFACIASPALASTIYGNPEIASSDLSDPGLTDADVTITTSRYRTCDGQTEVTQSEAATITLTQPAEVDAPAGSWCEMDVFAAQLCTTVDGETSCESVGWVPVDLANGGPVDGDTTVALEL